MKYDMVSNLVSEHFSGRNDAFNRALEENCRDFSVQATLVADRFKMKKNHAYKVLIYEVQDGDASTIRAILDLTKVPEANRDPFMDALAVRVFGKSTSSNRWYFEDTSASAENSLFQDPKGSFSVASR